MRRPEPTPASVDVSPLRAALLAQATADGERLLAEADEEAAAAIARAERETAALVERARAEGRAAAELEAARERRRARREAHAQLLQAQGELYDELRREASAGVLRLRGEPGYPALLERLTAAARAQLGDEVELEIDPPGRGGVVARAGSRSVDYSLPALVDRCLASLGSELERLWR